MENEKENEIEDIKVILLGEMGVGKSNLLNAAADLRFDEISKSTVTSTYIEKRMRILNKDYKVKLWDTAGQEKYRALTKLFYQDSKVVIFVYDITNKKSFTELNYWINEIKEALGNEPILGIVGNKSDLTDMIEVDEKTANEFAKEKGIELKLLSTKNEPKNFKKFLRKLVKDYLMKTGKLKENEGQLTKEDNNQGSCTIL